MSVRFGHASLSDRSRPGRPSRGGLGGVARVLGRGPGRHAVAEDGEESEYRTLGRVGSLLFASQRTGAGTPPRVHLDIETDDVPAEVARVLALGASVMEERKGYTILRDPAGMVFCVVPVQTGDDFEREALTWDELEFDRLTAVSPAGEGRYAADLSPGWVVGGGLNGGYLLAVIGQALRAAATRQTGPGRRQRPLRLGVDARPGHGLRRRTPRGRLGRDRRRRRWSRTAPRGSPRSPRAATWLASPSVRADVRTTAVRARAAAARRLHPVRRRARRGPRVRPDAGPVRPASRPGARRPGDKASRA